MKAAVHFLACTTGLISAAAQSAGTDTRSPYDLTLKELINIEVAITSNRPEAITETPAIVSRYSREDLEKMGISNLREMFNFVPGVIVQDALTGWASVQIRGIDEAFNQKVLFLLDGVPYHQPSHSMIPMEGVPWESISHVEVIRGPGAVFHGTQASGGVFNVVTRKDNSKRSASFKVGSHGLKEGSAFYHQALTDDSKLYAAAEVRREDGTDTTYNQVFPDIGIVTDEVHRVLERESALIRYTNKSATLQLQAFKDITVGINDAFTDRETLQPFITQSKGYLIRLENNWHSENSQATLFTDYNHYTFDLNINNLFAPGVHSLVTKDKGGQSDYRVRMGGNFSYQFSPSIELALGIEKETRSVGNYRLYFKDQPDEALTTLIPKGNIDEFSAYAQLEYNYQNLHFFIGTRFTDNENSGYKATPRAAFVYNIDPQQSIKVLYSTGFNSPNPTQTSIDLPGNVIGNHQLNAEVVEAIDVAYSYSKPNTLFVANIYHLNAEDFIIRRYSEPLESVSFFNEGNYKRQGAELDLQIARDNRKLFLNVAYQKSGNLRREKDPDAFRIPRLTMSAGASMDLNETHSIGANISYIGKRNNLNDYSLVNINYTARFDGFDVFVVARNIFDEDIVNPNNSSQNSTLVSPGEEGANIQLGVRTHF